MKGQKVPVYGEGKNVRDWIHVYDHNTGVDLIVRHGKEGEVYNLGGRSERDNLTIVKTILKALNKPEDLIEFVADRPGHDLRYAMDPTKAENELGWTRKYNFDDGMQATIDWYMTNQGWVNNIENGEYRHAYQG